MNMCRTCLETPADKNISELEKDINDDNKNCIQIMLFCLDIKITQDSRVTTNLCNKCYKNVILFYKFKVLSLKSDAYLKSLDPGVCLIDINADDSKVKHEDILDSNEYEPSFQDFDDYNTEVKVEVNSNRLGDLNSDEPLQSVDPKIKYEYIEDDIKRDNATICNKPVAKQKESSSKKTKTKKENTLKTTKKETSSKEPKLSTVKGKPSIVKQKLQICAQCGKSVSNLLLHTTQHRSLEERRTLKCQACPKLFCNKKTLERHYQAVHLGIKAKCEICKKEFSTRGLSSHMQRKHTPSVLRFACVLCTCTRSELQTHAARHAHARPYECDMCHRVYGTKQNVAAHIRQVHFNERNYQCELCSKAYFDISSLQEHLGSHSKERLFKCTDCDKSFFNKSTLRRHLLCHNSVKNYHCGVCDKSFLKLDYLKVHTLTHTKEKRHPCQFCGVRFGRSTHRQRHERTVHRKLD